MRLLVALVCLASQSSAETVYAARTIPAQTLIAADDLVVRDQRVAGAIENPDEIIGKEARVALYAGRPITIRDIGLPAIVERNQIITLQYQKNGLMISTEGRALGRAGPGDVIRVMNLGSRNTVTAIIGSDGKAYVSK